MTENTSPFTAARYPSERHLMSQTWRVAVVGEIDDLQRGVIHHVDLSFDVAICQIWQLTNKRAIVRIVGVQLLSQHCKATM